MSLTIPFSDLVVLEWGTREAVVACGSLLAQVGAEVMARDDGGRNSPSSNFKIMIGNTQAARQEAFSRANIILMSSDRGDRLPAADRPDLIVCDIVAGTGAEGHWPDALFQAAAGLSDITGTASTPPSISDAPVVELQSAMFAASTILAAWRRRVTTGMGQRITVSLMDCALNALSSFLPLVFAGKAPSRSGNRHPMAAPWNSYRASDGWVLLCSASDEHWRRICDLIGREELKSGPLGTLSGRIANCDDTDRVVEGWTRTRTVAECVAALNAAGLAAGPIVRVNDLPKDPNLLFRGTISKGPTPPSPLSFVRTLSNPKARSRMGAEAEPIAHRQPLVGVRVLEIGQYTTAPVASKHLALLGAEVIKIEPVGGESSRNWPPHNDGQGYFFTMNNSNKRSCVLNLRDPVGHDTFTRLLQQSDVLVENLKPGSLDRLGFDPDTLRCLNPALVYCAISGFGKKSVYPGRPAFDTVIQAVSGLMDATQTSSGPVKLGISAADISGGIAGLFACLCGLEQLRRGGNGAHIDLSMQDVAVWLTQSLWNDAVRRGHSVLRCSDGYVAVDEPSRLTADLTESLRTLERSVVIDRLASLGIAAAPVRTLSEIGTDPAIIGSGAVRFVTDKQARRWPLFRPPYTFSADALTPLWPIGELGEADRYVDELCDVRR